MQELFDLSDSVSLISSAFVSSIVDKIRVSLKSNSFKRAYPGESSFCLLIYRNSNQ